MKCPACNNELIEIDIGGTLVDVCKGHCGGVWFDWFELKKVDEPFEAAGEKILEVDRDENLVVDLDKRRICPRCEGDVVMMRHFNSAKREIEVDECPKCAGFWLDAGELKMIREAFRSEEDKNKAAEAYIKKFMEDNYGQQLKEMREDREKMERFAKKFSQALRLICPSYYLPGKQKGGAF